MAKVRTHPTWVPPDVRIETVFKVVPPLQKITEGFGYLGVLLRNKETDQLQCHICGEWHGGLGFHIRKHGYTPKKYKDHFGLPKYYPLTSKAMSAKRSKEARKPENVEKLRAGHIKASQEGRMPATARGHRKRSAIARKAKNNPSYKNKHGNCDDQLLARYLIVCDQAGTTTPGRSDFKRIDPNLLNSLNHRWGNLNKFRLANKLPINEFTHNMWTREKIIGAIQRKQEELDRRPVVTDFRRATKHYPNMGTIYNHFGSFKRAIQASINPAEEE